MPAPAATVGTRADTPARAAKALGDALARVRSPKGALLFVSGALTQRLGAIADAAGPILSGVPTLVVAGAGVLTQEGEFEDQSAVAALAWSGGKAEPIVATTTNPEEVGDNLARLISDRAGKTTPAVLVFAKPDGFAPQTLEPLQTARGTKHVFGAGTVGDGGLAIDEAGAVHEGQAVGMILRGLSPPMIRSSHACRLLGPMKRITETRGAMVVSLDDEPALDVLSAMGEELVDQPLVFAVLAAEDGAAPEQAGRPQLVIRAVQGVDPARRSLLISPEIRVGMRLTFAIRNGPAARRDLETVTRELEREIAGAAPRFGIYLNCAGRGSGLYGAHDVDSRILKGRFGDVPIAGMQSSFEIAPHIGQPTLQLYTGVLGMFTAPS